MRKSGLKKEMFGYVSGGYARVLQRFEKTLRQKGVEILLDSRVEKIEKLRDGKIGVSLKNLTAKGTKSAKVAQSVKAAAVGVGSLRGLGENSASFGVTSADSFEFDQVVVTAPSNIAAKMIPQLDPDEKEKLTGIKYQGIVCASVLMKNSLSNFYVTNVTDETPFTGIIEMSALVDKKEFGGNALVYLPKYVAPDDELFEKSDAEIEEIFLTGLEKMYPHFDRMGVLEFKISRVRQVFPIPVLNYSGKLPDMQTSIDGVFIVNSAHIVNGTLNVNETVQLAERFFEENFKQDVPYADGTSSRQ